MAFDGSIGVLGGTGPAGSGFALRYASLGHSVVIGSRDASRAIECVQSLISRYPEFEKNLSGGDNAFAAQADMVMLATPWEGTEDTIVEISRYLEAKVVITMVNALYKQGKSLNSLILPRGSVAQHIVTKLPGSKVVAAFHHAPAKELGNVDTPLDLDVLVCSDHDDARLEVIALANEIPGARGIDAGTLASAQAIESMTAVLININVKYKTRSSIKLSGIKV